MAFRKEEEAVVEGRTRLPGLQRVGEGAKRRQDNRGGGFLAVQEQRQDLLLWWACMWMWAQASSARACPCCGHTYPAGRLFSAAVGMTRAYCWSVVQRFWACYLFFPRTSLMKDCSYLGCLDCLSCPWRAVILYPDRLSSNLSLTLLFQNLDKTTFCGEKVMIWVSTAEKPGRSKSQLVTDCMKWCDALLILPTSHCFSALMLWQLVTQSSSKTFCTRRDVFIFLSAVLPML